MAIRPIPGRNLDADWRWTKRERDGRLGVIEAVSCARIWGSRGHLSHCSSDNHRGGCSGGPLAGHMKDLKVGGGLRGSSPTFSHEAPTIRTAAAALGAIKDGRQKGVTVSGRAQTPRRSRGSESYCRNRSCGRLPSPRTAWSSGLCRHLSGSVLCRS